MKKLKYIFGLTIISSLFPIILSSANLGQEAYDNLAKIHDKIHLIHGDKTHELPEQLLAANFLPPDAKVLELGGDVGRNSCVIGTILEDSRNLVTIEPRREAIKCLVANRNNNGLHFSIEPSAISKQPLIQKGWISKPSEVVLPGYERINTMSFDEVQQKYSIMFDTLVIDCEGALYYILQDQPEILSNIKLVIIENDFACAEHCFYVVSLFREYGLELIHSEGGPYWGENSFYQVWQRNI